MTVPQLDSKALEASRIVIAPNQISSDLAGEAVILDLQSGVYYGLNEIGARIWNLIQKPTTFKDIRATLLHEYEVEPEVCDRDLQAILNDLVGAGLVTITYETVA